MACRADFGMINTVAIRLTFSIVLMLFGLYMLMCGIRRKGLIYSNPALHDSEHYDAYAGMVRVFCFILPCVFLANLIVSFMSFSAQNRLERFMLSNDAQGYYAGLDYAKKMYSTATVTLIVSIAAVVIMIAAATLVTAIHSGDKNGEKLSGDHPAFRK